MMMDNDNSTENNYFGPTPENVTHLWANHEEADLLAYHIRIAVCAVILALGTTGNVLVATVILKTKELRNSTNLFLVNLSLADLLVLLVCVPLVLMELHSMSDVWLLGEGMCKVVPYIQLTASHGSVLTILAISFERYYAICQPLKDAYTCTQKRALAVIGAIWLVVALFTTPVLFTVHYHLVETLNGDTVPICYQSIEQLWQKLYYLSAIGVFYALPFLILLAVYCRIARHLIAGRGVLAASSSQETQMRTKKQVVLMMMAVVVSFFVCLLPFRVFTIWMILSSPEDIISIGMDTYYSLLYFCRLMVYIHAALNPILYNAISSKFRNSFIQLIRCSNVRRRLMQIITKQPLHPTLPPPAEEQIKIWLVDPSEQQPTTESHC